MQSYAKILVCVIMLGSPIFQQKKEPPSQFIISTPKTTYVVYEPIRITFTLTNDHDREIRGDYGLGFGLSQLKLYYRSGSESFHRYASERTEMPREYSYDSKGIPISAHGQISEDETILFDIQANRFVLSEPGEYEFRASFNYILTDSSMVESNVLRVKVLPLPSEENSETLSIWKDPYLARLIQGDSVSPLGDELSLEERRRMVFKKLKALVDNYPSSIYTQASKQILLQRYEEIEKRGLLTESVKEVLNVVRQARQK